MINTRNAAPLRSSPPGELHAKETKNGEIVLYASKKAGGTGLKNFLFGTDKERRQRAEKAIAEMVRAYEAGETPSKTIRFIEQPASPQSLREAFGRKKLESEDGSGIRDIITNPRLRNIKALFLAYLETPGHEKSLSTFRCMESLHRFETHPNEENLRAVIIGLADSKLPLIGKDVRFQTLLGCQQHLKEPTPARLDELKRQCKDIAHQLSESLVREFKLMNAVVRNAVSTTRGEPDAVMKLLPPWVQRSDTGAVTGQYQATGDAGRQFTDVLHGSFTNMEVHRDLRAANAGSTTVTLAKGFHRAAVHVTLDGKPMIPQDPSSPEEALEAGYENLLAFVDGDKNVAEVLSRVMREETLLAVRDQLRKTDDAATFIPVAMAAPKNDEPPAYRGSDGQLEVFDQVELSRFGGATWSLSKGDASASGLGEEAIIVHLEWYSYFDQARSPGGEQQLRFEPMRLGIDFEIAIKLDSAKQGVLEWGFTAVPAAEIDGYLPASAA